MLNFMTRGPMRAYAADGEGGSPPAGTPEGGAAPPAASWLTGLDAELTGVAQTKGWHDKPADVVARDVLKAYREAERFIGAPADKILRLPTEGDAAATKAFWQRLGAPDDPSKYDFSSIKFSDGSELDAGFTDHVRAVAAELNLPVETARRVAEGFVKFLDQAEGSSVTENAAKVQADQAALDASWGANKEQNLFVAKRAAAAAGVSDEEFKALQSTPGGAKMLEMFRFFGSKMGEDKFIDGEGRGPQGAATREQAVAERASLMKDEAWVKRYLAGDTEANRKMMGLNALIVGESGANYSAA